MLGSHTQSWFPSFIIDFPMQNTNLINLTLKGAYYFSTPKGPRGVHCTPPYKYYIMLKIQIFSKQFGTPIPNGLTYQKLGL